MNTNISSLKTIVSAISAEDRISDVIKIMEDGKDAGYMLVFVNSGSAALYHWTDVNEGYTPCIGVRKDNSGTFCWVLDGDWILDDISNRIPAGSGQTAIPKLKLDAENWWLSVDDGETWQQLETSVQGEESCSFFQNIDPAQKQNVTITFNDGTKITLPKEEEKEPADNGTYDPWDGYTDPDVYEEQYIINLTNALMANMHDCNLATRHIMDIAYNFWKRR
jgi:hypothetical protein